MPDLARTIRNEAVYRALRLLLAAARPLPLPVLRATGRAIGSAVMGLAGRERTRAREHLALAFPERDPAWREEILAACARHLGTLLGEVAWLWHAPREAILARTSFEGLEHLKRDSGTALVTAHCGNWEWMMLALTAAGVPMSVVAREVYDPRLDVVARTLRGRFGGQTFLRGDAASRRLKAALAEGRVMGLLIDQDIDATGVFVEFFGRPAWTPVGAAALALRSGIPVVAGFATRLPDGTMRLAYHPQESADDGKLAERAALLTARLTARIEAQIRSHPEQWVWMHRRWRRQPGPGDRVWSSPLPRDDTRI